MRQSVLASVVSQVVAKVNDFVVAAAALCTRLQHTYMREHQSEWRQLRMINGWGIGINAHGHPLPGLKHGSSMPVFALCPAYAGRAASRS